MENDVEMSTQMQQETLVVDQTWSPNNNSRAAVPYTVDSIAADITPLKDKPQWPLSSYGPSKHEPVVISGLDESPEELRLKAATALKAGTIEGYAKYESERTTSAEQIYANARENVRQLYEQALKVSSQTQGSASATGPLVPAITTSVPSAFGTTSTPSAFGGATTTAFGKSPFGQPAFGQTSFGGPMSGTSAFGQGAQGVHGTSVFGASPQPASVFSHPSQPTSAFGQPTQTTSAFGQSTQSSVFGQPSALGATAPPVSVFAQPSTQPTSVFGKPSQPTSVFGQSQSMSAFGQPSQPTSAFGQPSSTLSQPSQSAFGQSPLIKPASGAFGSTGSGGFSAFVSQPSTFTSAAAPSSSTAGTTTGQSAFGSTPTVQSAFGTVPSAPRSVFGTSQPSPFGGTGTSLTVPSLQSPASAISGNSPFTAFSPMTITPLSDKPASGAPDFASAKLMTRMKPGADRYLDLFPRDYSEMIPVDIRAAFTSAKFEWGKIPEWIPPEEVR